MSIAQDGIRRYKIASIPGDGIGIEVVEQTIKVLRAIEALFSSFTLDIETLDWSSKRYLEKGEYIPADGLQKLKVSDAILFGAVGSPGTYRSKRQRVLSYRKFYPREVMYLTTMSPFRSTRRHLSVEPDSAASEEGG
jgi:isocitrate/isopropylmalate dehydrogenase